MPDYRDKYPTETTDEYIEYLHSITAPPVVESVCQEADRLVATDRQAIYGHPLDDFNKVVGAARALGIDPTESAEEHALYMIIVKLARLSTSPGHHDSIVDICGYAKTYDLVLTESSSRVAAQARCDELARSHGR